MIQTYIFEHFRQPVMETQLVKDYAITFWRKAKPSDGSGAYYRNKDAGIELVAELDEDAISTIFLTPKFTGELPNGLQFNMSRIEVRKLLGQPDWSLEIGGTGILAITNPADKWWLPSGDALRVEYTEDEISIKLLSVASQKTETQYR
jgi:hypothetical protein